MSDRRDSYLRASLLNSSRIKGAAMEEGWVTGSVLAADARDDEGQPVGDDANAARLIGDLVGHGLLEEKRNMHVADASTLPLRSRRFRQTQKAFKLWMGDIDPIPGIYHPSEG